MITFCILLIVIRNFTWFLAFWRAGKAQTSQRIPGGGGGTLMFFFIRRQIVIQSAHLPETSKNMGILRVSRLDIR